MQKAAVGGVQHAEAILARLHVQKRKSFSIRHHHVAENLGHPRPVGIAGYGIVELAVLLEQAIVNHQRDFESAFGKIKRVFKIVANEKASEHARVNIQPIDAHGVIVIPERRGFLSVGIEVGPRLSWNVPILGISVALRRSLGAVDMDHAANFGLIGFGAVQAVIDRQEMFGGQFVGPFNEKRLAASRLKRRTRRRGAVTPQTGCRKIAMQFALQLAASGPGNREL